jgi:hypothetical protein
MRFDALALTCLGVCLGVVLAADPLRAACNKPDAPTCATRTIPFATDKDADDCRLDMLSYRDRMDRYAACLGETSSEDEKTARAEYEDIRVRFNRRARGEF